MIELLGIRNFREICLPDSRFAYEKFASLFQKKSLRQGQVITGVYIYMTTTVQQQFSVLSPLHERAKTYSPRLDCVAPTPEANANRRIRRPQRAALHQITIQQLVQRVTKDDRRQRPPRLRQIWEYIIHHTASQRNAHQRPKLMRLPTPGQRATWRSRLCQTQRRCRSWSL